MNILPTYLTKTLNPALHETRIKARDAVYRVEYQYEGKSGDYIYIRQMGLSCPWWIVATPGFDGGPEGTVLWQVCDDDGVIDHTGDVEIEWTGDVKYDVDIYLHAMRNVIIHVMKRLHPPPMTKTIVMLNDGETWGICAHSLDITDEEYERISEGGEKIRNVITDWESRADPV
jgi:hypothetical protein|tara:strand:- start:263 stop:781 length:519 start_codon:yes stop_codon:yes gene_type:complete